MLGEHEKDQRKILLTNFKERPSKLEKGYAQVLVKQTVVILNKGNFYYRLGQEEVFSFLICSELSIDGEIVENHDINHNLSFYVILADHFL